MVTARLRRGAGADEVHVAERRGPRVGRREGQTPGVQPGSQEFPEPWLVNGELPGVQLVYLPGVVSTPRTSNPRLAMQAACVMPRYPVPSTDSRSGLLPLELSIGSPHPRAPRRPTAVPKETARFKRQATGHPQDASVQPLVSR